MIAATNYEEDHLMRPLPVLLDTLSLSSEGVNHQENSGAWSQAPKYLFQSLHVALQRGSLGNPCLPCSQVGLEHLCDDN